MNETVPARNIGSYVPMIDGPEKVSGRAKYTADLIAPGMLAGRIYRSPYSHAEILEVDIAEALRLPGVKAIVTGADPPRRYGAGRQPEASTTTSSTRAPAARPRARGGRRP